MIELYVYTEASCITSCEYCNKIIAFFDESPPLCKSCGSELPPISSMLHNIKDRIDYFIYNGD